jgi:hypothetical protein
MTPGERKSLIKGVAFISPWILGFLAFNLYPLIASIWTHANPALWCDVHGWVTC